MSALRKYLPLFNADECWIERPDLYLLARMGSEDRDDENVVSQVYEAMCRSNNTRPRLDNFGLTIEKNHISRNLRERLWAGQVLLEMVRITATTRKPPSQTKAIRLAIFNHSRTLRIPLAESFERNVRRACSSYRDTIHLQASMVIQDPSVEEIEGSLENTVRFLSRARGLERFIDNYVAGGLFEWSPWRVPMRIPVTSHITIEKLSKQELKIIGQA